METNDKLIRAFEDICSALVDEIMCKVTDETSREVREDLRNITIDGGEPVEIKIEQSHLYDMFCLFDNYNIIKRLGGKLIKEPYLNKVKFPVEFYSPPTYLTFYHQGKETQVYSDENTIDFIKLFAQECEPESIIIGLAHTLYIPMAQVLRMEINDIDFEKGAAKVGNRKNWVLIPDAFLNRIQQIMKLNKYNRRLHSFNDSDRLLNVLRNRGPLAEESLSSRISEAIQAVREKLGMTNMNASLIIKHKTVFPPEIFIKES